MTRAVAEPSTAPADAVFDAVEAIRAPGALTAKLADAWPEPGGIAPGVETRILQTHYKPFVRARILAEMTGLEDAAGRAIRQYLFIQVYPSAKQARRRFAAGASKHALLCAGPPVVLVEELNALVWLLPNGPRLRPAKIGFRPRKLRKMLRKLLRRYGLPKETIPRRPGLPTLVRYVPRRRALFHHAAPKGAGYPSVFIKVYAPDTYRIARRNHRLIRRAHRAGELDFQPPRVLVTNRRRRCVVLKRLRGKPFTDAIPACRAEAFAAVGAALASLHACSIRPASPWTVDLEVARLRSAADDMASALPALAPRLDDLVSRLDAGRPAFGRDEGVPIHANLFGDQILLRRGRVQIVDWDDLSDGDPMFDVGRLLAHACYVVRWAGGDIARLAGASDALLASYRQSVGVPLPRERLAWHVAVALLMRAKISALRPLPPGWMPDIAACVEEAGMIVDGRSSWLRLTERE
jgi:hypothetical protein